MDDIKYEYVEDIKQKKSTARGAKHRNVKHRRVTLPNDNLSKKEWKKMNGPLKEIDLSAKYSWNELKEFDARMIADYLDYLVRRFGCNNRELCSVLRISESMFCLVKKRIKSVTGKDILKGRKNGVKGMDEAVQLDWDNFLNPVTADNIVAKLHPNPDNYDDPNPEKEIERKVFSPTPSEIIIRWAHIMNTDDDIISEAKKRLAAEMYELISKLDDEEEIFVTISLSKSIIKHDIHY